VRWLADDVEDVPVAVAVPEVSALSNAAGIRRDTIDRSGSRLSGRSSAVKIVSVAIMPQPRSTPANDGTMAPSVGMTDPTVAPIPKCASGISAT
jgi:hypothetical protein